MQSSNFLFFQGPALFCMCLNFTCSIGQSLQGALDGGLDIPHSEKRFAGFSKDSKQLDSELHRKYIYGGHVASYMTVFSKSYIVMSNT